jgi:hypothetical protein
MPSISLSGTKTLLAGKFGDAFRRFETILVIRSHGRQVLRLTEVGGSHHCWVKRPKGEVTMEMSLKRPKIPQRYGENRSGGCPKRGASPLRELSIGRRWPIETKVGEKELAAVAK